MLRELRGLSIQDSRAKCYIAASECAGLKLLRLLLLNREQLQPVSAALCRLLSELLLDASTPHHLPEDVRADLYLSLIHI